MILSTSGIVIPREIFMDTGGFPLGYQQNEDRYLRARVALNYSVAYSPEKCVIYHYSEETYINRRNTCFIEDSFSKYVADNKISLERRDDYVDICEFCDRAQLIVSHMNICGGYSRRDIRKVLRRVKSPNLKLEKTYYMVLSYLPITIINWVQFLIRLNRTLLNKISS